MVAMIGRGSVIYLGRALTTGTFRLGLEAGVKQHDVCECAETVMMLGLTLCSGGRMHGLMCSCNHAMQQLQGVGPVLQGSCVCHRVDPYLAL
jgi:hypothetical protein